MPIATRTTTAAAAAAQDDFSSALWALAGHHVIHHFTMVFCWTKAKAAAAPAAEAKALPHIGDIKQCPGTNKKVCGKVSFNYNYTTIIL